MTWYGLQLTLSDPAESALFAMMLSRELRQELNGWSLGLQEAGRLASPLFGAGLFALRPGHPVCQLPAALPSRRGRRSGHRDCLHLGRRRRHQA
jgi:hypothetical protein